MGECVRHPPYEPYGLDEIPLKAEYVSREIWQRRPKGHDGK